MFLCFWPKIIWDWNPSIWDIELRQVYGPTSGERGLWWRAGRRAGAQQNDTVRRWSTNQMRGQRLCSPLESFNISWLNKRRTLKFSIGSIGCCFWYGLTMNGAHFRNLYKNELETLFEKHCGLSCGEVYAASGSCSRTISGIAIKDFTELYFMSLSVSPSNLQGGTFSALRRYKIFVQNFNYHLNTLPENMQVARMQDGPPGKQKQKQRRSVFLLCSCIGQEGVKTSKEERELRLSQNRPVLFDLLLKVGCDIAVSKVHPKDCENHSQKRDFVFCAVPPLRCWPRISMNSGVFFRCLPFNALAIRIQLAKMSWTCCAWFASEFFFCKLNYRHSSIPHPSHSITLSWPVLVNHRIRCMVRRSCSRACARVGPSYFFWHRPSSGHGVDELRPTGKTLASSNVRDLNWGCKNGLFFFTKTESAQQRKR